MLHLQPAMWHADVDYIRLTCKPGELLDSARYAYNLAFEEVAGTYVLPSYKPEPWQMKGYRGVRLGPIAWGEGAQGVIIQASGAASADLARRAMPHTGIPRIDLQATYWLPSDLKSLAASVCDISNLARFQRKGRPWKVVLYQGFGEGDTAYIGSRGGETKYLRCYDKWRQQDKSPDWQYAWRFEAELTDGHARYAYGSLIDGAFDHYHVLAVLAAYWEERGITLPEVYSHGYQAVGKIRRPPESVERTVRWLEEQVAPALEKAYARGLTEAQAAAILGFRGVSRETRPL